MNPAQSLQQLTNLILSERVVAIKGKRSWWQILTNFEARNKYQILDQHKNLAGWIIEQGGGLLGLLKRWILKSHRPLRCNVVDQQGQPLLQFRRKFFFFFSDIEVFTPQGQKLGSAHRRFALLAKRYDLKDPTGQVFAKINSGFFRLWTFKIFDPQGNERAQITKKWGGALKEMFTDADMFLIDYGPQPWRAHERAVIFATAMSIDFDFFERNSSSLFG